MAVSVGVVKSFNPEKGWGHIECDATFQLYGKDIFLLRSQLNGLNEVQKGQQVSFSVTDGGRGPEAANVQVLGGVGEAPQMMMSAPMAATPAVSSGYGGGYGCGGGGYAVAGGDGCCGGGGSADGTYTGTIKSFNPSSGWGHIECPETHQLYGKDIFFMKSQIPGGHINKGATVAFGVLQGQKGPEATSIQPMADAMVAPMAQQWGPSPVYSPPAQTNSSQFFYGTVKSFNDEKGWGHIECPQTHSMYGKDIFVLRSALGGSPVKAGDQVQFSVSMGMKGPEAGNVKGLSTSSQDSFVGVIKQWNEEKGYGFISCDETRQQYSKDIFIHKNELGGNSLNVGDTVQFSVQISAQGRPAATAVQVASGYAPHQTSAYAAAGYSPY